MISSIKSLKKENYLHRHKNGMISSVATINIHQRLLFTMDNCRCGRNDFCPLDSNRCFFNRFCPLCTVAAVVDMTCSVNDNCPFVKNPKTYEQDVKNIGVYIFTTAYRAAFILGSYVAYIHPGISPPSRASTQGFVPWTESQSYRVFMVQV